MKNSHSVSLKTTEERPHEKGGCVLSQLPETYARQRHEESCVV